MKKEEFFQILGRWPDLKFTAIECVQYNGRTEIYATDMTSQTRSNLLLYTTSDAAQAAEIADHFRLWLGRFNQAKNKQ